MIHAGPALARRIESGESETALDIVKTHRRRRPDAGAESLAIAGGCAAFLGPESPFTHAVGLAMDGPISAAALDEIERFFRSRGAPCHIDLCPLADPSLAELLGQRGYGIGEFNNVLVRPLGDPPPPAPSGTDVRRARPEEIGIWASTVAHGFFGREQITTEELAIGENIFPLPAAEPFLAWAGAGGPAGAGLLICRASLAGFFGDATLPWARGRGVHAALIAARLREASASGCDLAYAGTLPGSVSQRNYERAGFRVVYTKVILSREFS